MKIEKYIENNNLGIVLKHKSFKDLTTMKVGGKIKHLFYPNSMESLCHFVSYMTKLNKRYFILGNGSNIIASDKTCYTWIVSGKHISDMVMFKDDLFIVSAFMDLRKLIANLLSKNINTLTLLSGIPATLGGAIYMNASANGYEISDDLLWVKVIENGDYKVIKREDLKFTYRTSPFKKSNLIIVEAAFKAYYATDGMLLYEEVKTKRAAKQPLNYPNSGSIFMNDTNYKAYEIIKKLNLVGYRIGRATFSSLHANFIINLGNAKAKDIYNLIVLAKKMALVHENIRLHEEVILFNFGIHRMLF